MGLGFVAIDLFGVEELFGDDPGRAVGIELAEEAGAVTLVTGGAFLVDLDENGVGIAIIEELAHFLGVSGGFAFHPHLVTGTAEEPGLAGGEGLGEGFLIHVGNHEYVAGGGILHDGGEQAMGVEFKGNRVVCHAGMIADEETDVNGEVLAGKR